MIDKGISIDEFKKTVTEFLVSRRVSLKKAEFKGWEGAWIFAIHRRIAIYYTTGIHKRWMYDEKMPDKSGEHSDHYFVGYGDTLDEAYKDFLVDKELASRDKVTPTAPLVKAYKRTTFYGANGKEYPVTIEVEEPCPLEIDEIKKKKKEKK